jgi:tricorn protease
VSWSPDGQKIAFVSKGKIWTVPAEGGEPAEVKADVDAQVYELDWSPDGRKIAFSGESGMDIEFWFMENFLHLLKK